MIIHQHKRGVVVGGVTTEKIFNVQASGELNLDEPVGDGSTNVPLDYVLDVSRVQSFFIVSDQAITVKTNSSGSPANTFTLGAGIPQQHCPGDPAWRDTAGDLMVDVTQLFVSNASGSAARLQIFCLYTPTGA